MKQSDLDAWHMQRVLELAAAGRGAVEPNPLVGCLVCRGAEIIGEGWHRRFGGAHAEVEALRVAGPRAADTTLYVNLEPCCHHGKTPPCSEAVIAAGVSRAVVAMADPFPRVAGQGIEALRQAGIEVELGIGGDEARRLNAPFIKRVEQKKPWVIAKWAMTLDGHIATATGDSQWISGSRSRALVHEVRGQVDAVIVGRGTVEADDPLLTARPPGPRVAARVVLDSHASLASDSQLVATVADAPVIVVVGSSAEDLDCRRLADAGCEIIRLTTADPAQRWHELLTLLAARDMTNVLVEGGAATLGSLVDADEVDEVLAFVAPKIIGGADAPSPVRGAGRPKIAEALQLESTDWQQIDGDLVLRARVKRSPDVRIA